MRPAGGARGDAAAPEALRGALERALGRRAGGPVSVLALRRWAAGTVRHAFAVDLHVRSGALAGRHALVYLQDRPGARVLGRLTREQELGVLTVMHAAGVRVPRPYWCLGDGDEPAVGRGLLLARVEGETLARRILQAPAFDAVRPGLLPALGAELARIHAAPTDALAASIPGEAAAAARLDEIDRELAATAEPHPALELALRWLRARLPRPERVVLVHGDYRLGNLVVDSERGLRAVLDWELAHLGDPGEDLGWLSLRFWRSVDWPGTPGLGPRTRFYDAYAAATRTRLRPDLLRFWEVFAHLRWAVITLTQARRHLEGGESSLELASIGRRCAEVEWDLLRLLGPED